MIDLIVALGLVLVLEGTIYALFPGAMKRMVVSILAMPERALRTGGLVFAIVGVMIVWLARG